MAPGVPHHITQRGNRRQQTFFCEEDYKAYLHLMAEWCDSAILAVSGFGPALTAKLMDWRCSLERNFAFDPKKAIDPADVTALEKEISVFGANLEKNLLSGAAQLKQITHKVTVQRQALRAEAEQCLRLLAQAEADFRAIRM